MAKRTVVYVSTHKPSGWAVKLQGRKSPVSRHRLKSAAVRAGKRVAKKARLGQLKVKGRNGRIQREYTYGNDPRGGG